MKTKAVMTQIPVEKSCKVALGTGATAKTLTPIESSIAPANLLTVSLPSPGLNIMRAQPKPPCDAG